MEGILDQPSQPAPTGSIEDEGNVTPEEQTQYDEFVNNAYNLIYDDKSMPQILKGLVVNGNPVDGLANTAAMVVSRLKDSATQNGTTISPDVLLHGGTEILEDLADLAAQAGVHEYTDEEIEGATYKAMDVYREAQGIDGGADRPAIMQDMQGIAELSKTGTLDTLAKGLQGKGDKGNGALATGPAAPPAPAAIPDPRGI